MSNPFPVFHRPVLSKKLARQILIRRAASAISSGLFLAAPRRTGKSTFLREDFLPELQRHGATVVYADLWADPGTGAAALFALKAARDELNSSRHHGLRLVCTGSNRDQLATLRNSKDQAFFGAPMVDFPTLDMDFVTWFCAEAALPSS